MAEVIDILKCHVLRLRQLSAERQAWYELQSQGVEYDAEQCVGVELDSVLRLFDVAIAAAKSTGEPHELP